MTRQHAVELIEQLTAEQRALLAALLPYIAAAEPHRRGDRRCAKPTPRRPEENE